ncbi:Matrix metalloproteinase-25, partial [Galemys pyrenaicus]
GSERCTPSGVPAEPGSGKRNLRPRRPPPPPAGATPARPARRPLKRSEGGSRGGVCTTRPGPRAAASPEIGHFPCGALTVLGVHRPARPRPTRPEPHKAAATLLSPERQRPLKPPGPQRLRHRPGPRDAVGASRGRGANRLRSLQPCRLPRASPGPGPPPGLQGGPAGSLGSPRRPRQRRAMLRLLALLLPLLPPPARAPEPAAQDVSLGVDWLTRYGYLPPPHPAQAQLQSPATLQDAVKVMQRFAGLPETGLLDRATMAMMRKPRCSLPDVMGVAGLVRRRRRYALGGSVWKKRTLTWRIDSFPESSVLRPETVRTLMHHALAAWAVESTLQFQEVDSRGAPEADILIHFARAYHQDSYPFDGPGGTLAHAFFPGEHPISGDTHFDDEETWTFGLKGTVPLRVQASPGPGREPCWAPEATQGEPCRVSQHEVAHGEGTDLFAVAVHEFGHALGLGHSSAPDSIMRPFYQGPVGDPTQYRLSPDDQEGLQQLYGKGSHTPSDKPTRKPLSPPRPPVPPPDSPSGPVPDRCDCNFDAIANIRGETFFFKGPWFWRLQPSGQLVSPRPARLHRFWEGLPAWVKVVEAAYARHRDGRILLFSGPHFWVFQDRQLEGAARPISELGLPPGEAVDAVFSWPLNGKTYLIRGQRYWRYDEAAARPDPGYPRDLGLWEGAPAAPDDVTVSNAGDTYFFKGAHFWRFPKGSVQASPDSPQPMGPEFLDCPAPVADPRGTRPPGATRKPGACDCQCEISRAAGRPSGPLLLPLLPLLLGGGAAL